MIELKSKQKSEIIENAEVFTDIGHFGSDDIASDAAEQIAAMIETYRSDHPQEMLPKSADQILQFMRDGDSVIIASRVLGNNGDLTVLYHGTVIPLLTDREAGLLGQQVVEFGAAVALPELRGGGLGTLGAKRRSLHARDRWGSDTVCLSTIKRPNTANTLITGAGFSPEPYDNYPHLTYLTCTCFHCSEVHGHMCSFRRQAIDVIGLADTLMQKCLVGDEIKCTLMISKEHAGVFEERCRHLSGINGLEPITPGRITTETMERVDNFYNMLREQL